ncbi:GNAT family N-acetyltransferase [Kribbella sp. CA-293567]|uniref:GNAT family N-acetyltransferase n=1 Tax=Kribbella sp. CA-293567 TaxID=3002436 RepID=UPI0022DD5EAC|nr:GNAT family N-acetyltransferase [Kribbella sp. CA-293567]WBQ03519.1 GNAT family N-acetyltransferase [Kribbella sp. CA-293567]
MTRSHLAGVVDLITADGLPGLPPCHPGELLRATGLSGTPSCPGPTAPRSFVAIGDRVLGAAEIARDSTGDVGSIRWLHAREEPAVVGELLDHAIARLTGCEVIEAFTSGGVGPVAAGLPTVRRTTEEALLARGFAAIPAGRYLFRSLPSAPMALPDPPRIEVTANARRHRLTIPRLAAATVSVLTPGHGMVHWIEVHPDHRGQGLGAQLLNACLRHLHRLGVRQVIGFLDDHNLTADDGHGRVGAHMICTRAGFVTGAQLATYSKLAGAGGG